MSDWIDISVPLRGGMPVWPGDPPVRLSRLASISSGDEFNVTECSFCAHTGTHVDAPLHALADGLSIDQMPLEALMGPCRVVRINHSRVILPDALPEDLVAGERLLFQTDNSFLRVGLNTFSPDFVHLSLAAARLLADANIRAVGIDYLSIAGMDADLAATHRALLGAGVWIIEGLALSRVTPGRYELACLPLRLAGADGAPARAALRSL